MRRATMSTSTNTEAGLQVTAADLEAIATATAGSRMGYRVEAERRSDGRAMVHVEAETEALTVHLLPNNDGTGWGALDHRGEEMATGETIREIVEEIGARLFV
jgi:hypothetical protein